jgi:hypothetical protein
MQFILSTPVAALNGFYHAWVSNPYSSIMIKDINLLTLVQLGMPSADIIVQGL